MTLSDALFYGWLSGLAAILGLVLLIMRPHARPAPPGGVVAFGFVVAVIVAAGALLIGEPAQ